MSDLYYNKAYDYLDAKEESVLEYLSTLREHIALNTQIESKNTSTYTTIKKLKFALTLLLREKNIRILRAGANALERRRNEEGGSAEKCVQDESNSKIKQKGHIMGFNCSIDNVLEVLSMLEMMFRKVLKDLVLNFSKSPKIKIVDQLDSAEPKRMFEIFLRASANRTKDGGKVEEGICSFITMAEIIEKIRAERKLDDIK